ncbi:SRPBCC family protein [Streptomyces purpurogeneiscleroticus]|uniref:SRPBCC family protein n=1 Tax=Streptomyces purpurogeneiscleroticus TaxID=68259 RepID=UPI001CBE23C8|nr:SRPBCC family protein [Streptomyces purpurogeneiscleroticus]MBZ4015296.1 cyclase [Streptomyces purpurogeneiscleroticus]
MADQNQGGTTALLKESIARSPATDRLKEEATAFAAAQAQRLLIAGGRKLGAATTRLQDMAEGNGPGLGLSLGRGLGRLVRGAIGARGGKRSGTGTGRFVTVVEDTDVGVPLRTAYDQWTQFQEFSSFAKGVQDVARTDDTTSTWRAKVFWSSRSWEASVTEQLPDRRIAWSAQGAKATLKGVVTFHELTPDLTRVLLVIEYYPKGLFERTGNLWRAQGRRARLDLKHFRRFVMLRGEATDGWRGEIRDGEVVESHEDAVAREEDEEAADTYEEENDTGTDEADEEAEGDAETYEGDEEEAYAYEEEEEGEPADEYEPEPERVR